MTEFNNVTKDNTKKKPRPFPKGGKSKKGTKVDSLPEKQIADYLDNLQIPYTKPRSAFKGEYYKNHKFRPDFFIEGVVIEFLGIKGYKYYDDTTKIKEESKYPNREYIFLHKIDEMGSLHTRFKHLVGKNTQKELGSN